MDKGRASSDSWGPVRTFDDGSEELERMSNQFSRRSKRPRNPALAPRAAPAPCLLAPHAPRSWGRGSGAFPRRLAPRAGRAAGRRPLASGRRGAPGPVALRRARHAGAGRRHRDAGWRTRLATDLYRSRFRPALPLDNYGWSEWIGERGAFVSGKIACGVLLLGPDTEYPAHSHEAEEALSPSGRLRSMARRRIRLAASGAGRTNSSSLMDGPRHAHRARAAACGLYMARGRSQRQVAHRPPFFRSGEGDAH